MLYRVALVCLLLAVTVALPYSTAIAAEEVWFDDMTRHHWAYDYVRVLWEEGVADGWYTIDRDWHPFLFTWFTRTEYHFRPKRDITRGEFLVLLTKTLGLTPKPGVSPFSDVPRGLLLYDRVPLEPYLNAAIEAELLEDSGNFRPSSAIRREEAIVWLLNALELRELAEGLSDAEVLRHLKRFRDWRKMDDHSARYVALAVSLKIVRGYPDRTLRPSSYLTRVEAAALIYRSCIFRLNARQPEFSPDGDGILDVCYIDVDYLRNRNIYRWALYIEDLSGEVVRTFSGRGFEELPSTVAWQGDRDAGGPVPNGLYFYTGWAQDRQGNTYHSVRKPILLQRKSLTVSVQPQVVRPGGSLRYTARTTGGAQAVLLESGDLPFRRITDTEHLDVWTLEEHLPLSTPEGIRQVKVKADYEDGTRYATVTVLVMDPISLQPSVSPNPAVPGTTLLVEAHTSNNVLEVTAKLDELAETSLVKVVNGWMGQMPLPLGMRAGEYKVIFHARSATKTITETVTLRVSDSPLQTLSFCLTD